MNEIQYETNRRIALGYHRRKRRRKKKRQEPNKLIQVLHSQWTQIIKKFQTDNIHPQILVGLVGNHWAFVYQVVHKREPLSA